MADNDPACIPTTVAQPYPHSSKVFDHPLKDKAVKVFNTLAPPHYSYIELLFVTAQSAAFISKKRYRRSAIRISQSVSYAQVNSSANVYENISKTENVHFQGHSTEFQKQFDLIKQIDEIL